jgi:class 3 adenylate cyclase
VTPGDYPAATSPNSLEIGESGPLHVAVLFVDFVGSTDLASVMALEEYARLGSSFAATCRRQCEHFFTDHHRKRYLHDGRHYAFHVVGDELCVFLHSERPHDDVYQLVCLAVTLKCAWLGAPLNAERVASGRPSYELAMGIHSGPVWATRNADGVALSGFAINLAKRVESASREGTRFRIFVSDPSFKLVNRRMRNLTFGPRRVAPLKGVSAEVGVSELVECFVDPARRMPDELAKGFLEVARRALATNSFDLWVHSCLQVANAAEHGAVSDEALDLCKRVLNIDRANAVALYHAADGERERGNLEVARLYLEDLVRCAPTLGDGWLALGRLLLELGERSAARRCILQARRHGVTDDEEALPGA